MKQIFCHILYLITCQPISNCLKTGSYVLLEKLSVVALISVNNHQLFLFTAMPDLIKLVHGNTVGLNKLMIKFRKQWTSKCLGRDVTDEEVDKKSPISKRQIEMKIQNIASKEKRNGRSRWYVHSHILEAFGLQNLLVVDGCNSSDASTETAKSSAALLTNTPSIIHFTRPVSPAPTRGASPELKNNTLKFNQASTPCSSTSPMEIDNKGSSGCDDISSCSTGANSHLKIDSESQSKSTSQVWNNTESSIITPILTGSKTNSNTENSSTGNVVKTVY